LLTRQDSCGVRRERDPIMFDILLALPLARFAA